MGEFTRSELIELHACLDAHLKLGSASATAWLAMTPKDHTGVAAVLEAASEYFCMSDGGLQCFSGRPRRIVAGLMGEFAPGASDDAIAGALRVKPAQVAASRRWLREAEKDERLARALAVLRQWIRAKLGQPHPPRRARVRG